ncbi:MAG TPA: hypothetical protein VJP58_00030, partial [Candidatus Nitrosocosmicus sp.]|nr:hypothetical protein [Candidatus Nitrosocosmicus sp.]
IKKYDNYQNDRKAQTIRKVSRCTKSKVQSKSLRSLSEHLPGAVNFYIPLAFGILTVSTSIPPWLNKLLLLSILSIVKY